jgi:hypothetical protein
MQLMKQTKTSKVKYEVFKYKEASNLLFGISVGSMNFKKNVDKTFCKH